MRSRRRSQDPASRSLSSELGAYGAAKVFVADKPELALFSSEGYTAALDAAATAFSPSIVLVSATAMGLDVAARFAARRGVGVLSDVMALDVENGRLVGSRPVYSGKARVTVTAGAVAPRSRSRRRARTCSRPRRPTRPARARPSRSTRR